MISAPHQYYSGDKTKNEMGEAFGTYVGEVHTQFW
jgi:hypothetical protein